MRRSITLAFLCLLSMGLPAFAQAEPTAAELATLRQQAIDCMRQATHYFRSQVATHGGYVYHYSLDLSQRWGEGRATPDQIWVQPPGTPAVGLAYAAAYRATGDDYYLDAVRETAEALVYGQLKSGGWTNCIDFDPAGERVAEYRNGRGGGKNNSSLDDGQSQTAIRCLMHADQLLGFSNKSVHSATELALDSLLQAQFPCGAFPQIWTGPVSQPLPVRANFPSYDWRSEGRIKNYWDLYTLNDNVAVYVAAVLRDADQIYDDPRYLAALKRLGDFLILAQLPEPQPAWAQQYNYDMQPVWARRFEPPGVSGHESQDVLWLLMDIYTATGDKKYLGPIPSALDYLRRSTLPDNSIARYYELESNRPLYMQRSGQDYSLTYDDTRLPDHYSWKTASEVEALQVAFDRLLTQSLPPAASQPAIPDAAEIRRIIDTLDRQGRWISTAIAGERLVGQAKFADGQPYISSLVFNSNLQSLADFVAATAGR